MKLSEQQPSQLQIVTPAGRTLLTITADGEWVMDETDAPEAAQVFVREVRRIVGPPSGGPAPGNDGPCQTCGEAYPCWRAPDDLWNLVMGGPAATDDPGGMLCPNCFLRLADETAPVKGAWVVGTAVRPEQVVAAEELRAAARHFEYEMSRAWGGDASWISTGTHVADLVADVLRELADDAEAQR